jgi:malonyl-CoA/methylmalonyl-CoA synthetase
VVDVESREPLPVGEVGEIEVRGPHVFEGYWEHPEATGEVFDGDGWFSTGDLGSISEDGYFTISGRTKELIISGGYNVYPREVEELLEGCPGVGRGRRGRSTRRGVRGARHRRRGARRPRADRKGGTDFCRDDLAGYKKPREVVFVDELPRNAMGKVLKHEVREGLVEEEV